MTAPADVVLDFKALTYALAGSQSTLATTGANNFAAIISADENYLYVVEGGDDLHIYDISNRTSPSSVGTAAVVDNLVFNKAITGLALDSTGVFLYLPDGKTKLYTLDLTDPEVPTLSSTLTLSANADASTNNRHVIISPSTNRLYLAGDSGFEIVNITAPGTPTTIGNFARAGGFGDGIETGYLTPDATEFLMPEIDGGTSGGQIFVLGVTDADPNDKEPIDIPNFSGASEVITVSGALNFESTIESGDRMWFIGKYTSGGDDSYFWCAYDRAPVGSSLSPSWEGPISGFAGPTFISDPVVGGEITPTHYLSNEPYKSRSWGVGSKQIVVEKSLDTSGEGVFISFWELDVDDVFPQLVIKEGGNQTEQISDLDASPTTGFNLFDTVELGSNFIVALGQAQTQIIDTSPTVFGALLVFIPTSVTVTDGGWQDIGSDANQAAGPIAVSGQGITGSEVRDRTAGTSVMTFHLNNHSPQGLYSPNHTNLKTGFVVGAPVRLRMSGTSPTPLKTKYLGRIATITPGRTLRNKLGIVTVTCVDSLDVLAKAKLKGIQIRTSITTKRIVKTALNIASGIPITADVTNALDDTDDIYDFAFDGIKDDETSPLSEIQKATISERGFFYYAYQNSLVGSDGGFRLESRTTRINSPVFATAADGALLKALIPEHSEEVIYNRVQGRVFPRDVASAPTTILFTLESTPKLKPGETLTFTAPYTDPNEQASRVSGAEMQPPITGTDFKFTTNENGGTDLTSNLAVNVQLGGSSSEVTLQNNGPTGFVFLFRLLGKGLFSYEPVTVTERDLLSVSQHGQSDVLLEFPHQEDLSVVKGIVNKVLAAYAQPRTFIRSARLIVAKSATVLNAFLDTEIGDKVFIEDDVLGIDMGTNNPFVLGTSKLDGPDTLANEAAVYVIHSISFTVGRGNHVEATWGLFPADVRL